MKDSERCESMATIRRFWPGEKPDLLCVDHAQDSEKVASVIGVYVHMEPIGYSLGQIVEEFPRCCCSKGFSQTCQVETFP